MLGKYSVEQSGACMVDKLVVSTVVEMVELKGLKRVVKKAVYLAVLWAN